MRTPNQVKREVERLPSGDVLKIYITSGGGTEKTG
jgi:TusA-related sulfurtransferase